MARLKVEVASGVWLKDDVVYPSKAAALQEGLRRGWLPGQLEVEDE